MAAASSPYAEELAAAGFLFIPRYAAGLSAIDAAHSLGEIDVLEGLKPVQTLFPRELRAAPPNTYSGTFGLSEFPLHTDLAHWARPPRFLVLRCVRGTSQIATRVLDGRSLIERIGSEPLRMALVQPRRPMRNGKQLLRLLERYSGGASFLLRWDSVYLQPASRAGDTVYAAVKDFLASVAPNDFYLNDPDDTLVLDNWRCLHGRSTSPVGFCERHINRVYLKRML